MRMRGAQPRILSYQLSFKGQVLVMDGDFERDRQACMAVREDAERRGQVRVIPLPGDLWRRLPEAEHQTVTNLLRP